MGPRVRKKSMPRMKSKQDQVDADEGDGEVLITNDDGNMLSNTLAVEMVTIGTGKEVMGGARIQEDEEPPAVDRHRQQHSLLHPDARDCMEGDDEGVRLSRTQRNLVRQGGGRVAERDGSVLLDVVCGLQVEQA